MDQTQLFSTQIIFFKVINFFKYILFMILEYDSLIRLGIVDPKSFIKKRFKGEPITYLDTCCAGAGIKDQIEASVEEALAYDTWVDIMVR